MAVPKKKTSPSRQGMRASGKHVAYAQMVACSNCGDDRLPHHMCSHCGHYNGRHVMLTKNQVRAKKAAEAEADE